MVAEHAASNYTGQFVFMTDAERGIILIGKHRDKVSLVDVHEDASRVDVVRNYVGWKWFAFLLACQRLLYFPCYSNTYVTLVDVPVRNASHRPNGFYAPYCPAPTRTMTAFLPGAFLYHLSPTRRGGCHHR